MERIWPNYVMGVGRGMFRIPKTPVCPHCKEIAPYGDERIVWNEAHLQSRVHAWWWKLKKLRKKNR